MRLALGLTHFKVGLLACFFLAIFSRFYLLADASLFRDEGHTIYVCQSWGRVWENLKGYPPLYWILEKTTLECLGKSIWALRFLSALSGVVTIPLLARGAYLLGGYDSSLRVAILATLSTFLVSSSQEARAYMFFGSLLAGLIAAVCWDERSRTKTSQALVVLLGTTLVFTDYLGIPLLVLAMVALPKWRLHFLMSLVLGFPVYFFLAWTLLAIQNGTLARGHFGGLPVSELLALIPGLIGNIFAYGSSGSRLRFLMGIGVVLAYLGLIACAPKRLRPVGMLALAGLTLSAFLNWKWGIVASAASRVTMVAPLFFFFAGVVTAMSKYRRTCNILFAFLVLTGSVDLLRGFYYFTPHRGGWKELGQWLETQRIPGPVFTNKYLLLNAQEYSNKFRSLEDLPGYHAPVYYYASDSGQDPIITGGRPRNRWHFVNVYMVELSSPPGRT